MRKTRYEIWSCGALLLALVGCDKRRDEPAPQPVPLPAPTPPPPVAPAPVAEPKAPPRPVVAKEPPEGLVPNQWVAGGKCNIESIGGPVASDHPAMLKSGTSTKMVGWGLDQKGAALADTLYVRFASKTGDYYGTPTSGIQRDDVPAYLHMDSKLATSGFELAFDPGLLAPGDYAVTVIIKAGQKTFICDNGRKVTVEP